MGISLKNNRNRRRRSSYANYKPRTRRQGPRNDPFRILIYLLIIAGGLWVIYHPQESRAVVVSAFTGSSPDRVMTETAGGGPPQGAAGPSGEDIPSEEVVSAQGLAEEAAQLVDEGRYEEAAELYVQAGDLDPEFIDYHIEASRLYLYSTYFHTGETRDEYLALAADAADAAILADPFSPRGYAMMGKVQDWQGNYEQALSTILRAIESDPTYARAQGSYAEALADLDRWDQSLETIEVALELEPNDIDVRRDYGYILETLGDYNSAVVQYEAALAIEPNAPHIRLALSRVYRIIGEYNRSLDTLFTLATLKPNSALLQYEIGRTYETFIGDPNEALTYFEKAVDIDHEYSTPWIRIGTIRYLQGSYVQAIPAFERAISLEVENADVYLQLGLSYAYEGQCGNATRYLALAQSLAPEDDERITDAVSEGYEICEQPTPVPVDVIGTEAPAEETP